MEVNFLQPHKASESHSYTRYSVVSSIINSSKKVGPTLQQDINTLHLVKRLNQQQIDAKHTPVTSTSHDKRTSHLSSNLHNKNVFFPK